jgi:hypothetical protein
MVIKLKKLLITLAATVHGLLTAGAAQAEQVAEASSGRRQLQAPANDNYISP